MTVKPNPTRRDFVKSSAVLTGAATFAALGTNFAYAAAEGKIKVGLVGCGGRGTGAAGDNLAASGDVELYAIGDLFQDRLDGARKSLRNKFGDRVSATDDHCFTGWDAYKKVIESGVDLCIFATPPGFRPQMIEAAIAAGKHVFAEKPVAVDPTGIRRVIAAADMARQKGLAIVAGTQRRHQKQYLETIARIHDGAIGQVLAGTVYWNQGGLWKRDREAAWSDIEWQIRNWLYFAWLSGDHICEQHIHNLDVFNWVMGGPPASALGLGGRQVRIDPAYGHIFDHHAIEFTYPNGARLTSFCRQQDGTDSNVSEFVIGSKGRSDPGSWIKDLDGKQSFRFKGEQRNPYEQEHVDLIASIKAGQPLNEGRQVAESTLTAILGRMSTYTGKKIYWDLATAKADGINWQPGREPVTAMTSKLDLMPKNLDFGTLPVAPVAMPGREQLI
jgi:predicted dehydrogenase